MERSGGAHDSPGQIRIQQEMLAEGPFRCEPVAGNDFA
jgi:hypothetical protein